MRTTDESLKIFNVAMISNPPSRLFVSMERNLNPAILWIRLRGSDFQMIWRILRHSIFKFLKASKGEFEEFVLRTGSIHGPPSHPKSSSPFCPIRATSSQSNPY